ncbi:MAG: cell division protein SepF [Candidatus Syntrophoarchaeum sp.]|nr:cell division protein SepF [Methanomicrobia archaeon]MBL7117834.1 cell division protein SepF [Candidatus Syntrophoarchaeum sp.]
MGMKGGLGKLFVKKEGIENEADYLDLDIEEYEEGLKGEESVKMYIKTAELTGLYDIPELKKEIYAGNMLILDISRARQDKVLVEKAIKDLKMAALDVGGDIAGISDDQVVVTPMGIKIERKKLSGK